MMDRSEAYLKPSFPISPWLVESKPRSTEHNVSRSPIPQVSRLFNEQRVPQLLSTLSVAISRGIFKISAKIVHALNAKTI